MIFLHASGAGATTRPSLAWLFVVLLTSCDALITVNDPEVVTPEDLDGGVGIGVIHAGAVGDFAVAWTGAQAEPDKSCYRDY